MRLARFTLAVLALPVPAHAQGARQIIEWSPIPFFPWIPYPSSAWGQDLTNAWLFGLFMFSVGLALDAGERWWKSKHPLPQAPPPVADVPHVEQVSEASVPDARERMRRAVFGAEDPVEAPKMAQEPCVASVPPQTPPREESSTAGRIVRSATFDI